MQNAVDDHDCNLLNLLKSASSANLKLNKKKLRLPLSQITYMGQLFTYEGLRPDPIKIKAMASMPRSDDKKAVKRLFSYVNYLSRFLSKLSELTEPLQKLTAKDAIFVWKSRQEESFQSIKNMIYSAPALKY